MFQFCLLLLLLAFIMFLLFILSLFRLCFLSFFYFFFLYVHHILLVSAAPLPHARTSKEGTIGYSLGFCHFEFLSKALDCLLLLLFASVREPVLFHFRDIVWWQFRFVVVCCLSFFGQQPLFGWSFARLLVGGCWACCYLFSTLFCPAVVVIFFWLSLFLYFYSISSSSFSASSLVGSLFLCYCVVFSCRGYLWPSGRMRRSMFAFRDKN